MPEAAHAQSAWVLLAYLVAGVCFILALRGLSSPESSRRGNRTRHARHGDRGRHDRLPRTRSRRSAAKSLGAMLVGGGDRPCHCAQDPDDGDAAAGRGVPQPGRHGGGAGRCGGLSQSRGVRDRGPDHADRQPVDHQHFPGQPDRDGAGRRHRRHHLLRVGDRVPQIERQHVGQADPAAAAACDQPRHAGRNPRPDRLLHPGPVAVGLRDGHRAQLCDRLPADHPDRRRRHAGRDLDAEQLFGLGCGGDGLHAPQQRDDHHRRSGRQLGRDPFATSCAGR